MKYLLTLLPLIFLGCYDANPTICKELGYKGILIKDLYDFGDNECSNGDIVNGNFISANGLTPTSNNTYFGFDGNITWMKQ